MTPSRPSGSISTDTQVVTGGGVLTYASASTGGTAAIYDGTSTAGILLAYIDIGRSQVFVNPPRFETGLFVAPTSTAAPGATVHTL